MRCSRQSLSLLILWLVLTSVGLGAAAGAPSPDASPFAATGPVLSPPEIHQATEAVLSQAKYRREPNWLQKQTAKWWDKIGETLSRWLGALFGEGLNWEGLQIFFWIALTLLGAILLLLGLVALARRRQKVIPPEATKGPRLPRAAISPLALQAQARQLARQGQFGAALRLLYQACLHHLDRRGALSFQRSTTNGEYLRQLRPHPELYGPLANLARLVEVHFYGGREVYEPDYRAAEGFCHALLRGGGKP